MQNQGATCYLNSLLQSLYLDPSFRGTVYQWRYDEQKDGAQKDCIPFQLQLLFAELQIGDNGVAKTGALTHSFGWVDGQQYQQHDVQELMRVLLNAVELSFKEKETDPDTRITPLYSGMFEDTLECLSCGHKKVRKDPYLDVQLFIEQANSVAEAFNIFVTPETLNGGNQITCDGCHKKVDANKGLRIGSVPQILTLQLKRFTYNPVTWQRIKLSKRVTYPLYFNMAPFLNRTRLPDDELQAVGGTNTRPTAEELAQSKDALWYELFSVLIHSGGAMGGHYYAYCKDVVSGKWFNFNDMEVKAISEEDALSMAGQDNESGVSTNAYMLLYRRMQPEGESFDAIQDACIPPYIKQLIETENEDIKVKKHEYEEQMRNVSVNMFLPGAGEGDGVQMLLERKWTVTEAAVKAAEKLGLPLEGREYRLRGYIPRRGKVSAESFVGRENDTLLQLAFFNNKNCLLQSKRVGDEWEAEIPSFQVEIVLANHGKNKFEEPKFFNIRANATVRQLMNLVYYVYKDNGIFFDLDDIALVRIHGESFEHTSRRANWNKTLNDLGIIDGARVYAESRLKGEDADDGFMSRIDWNNLKPSATLDTLNSELIYGPKDAAAPAPAVVVEEGKNEEVSEWNSFVVQQFEIQKNTIELFYNIPKKGLTEAELSSVRMEEMIEIDQRLQLRELRKRLAEVLGLEQYGFVIRKNLDKKECREDDATIADLKIYNGSALLLEVGTPMNSEQVKIRLFYFDDTVDDTAAFQLVCDTPISKLQSLGELKAFVRGVLRSDQSKLVDRKFPEGDFPIRLCERMSSKLSRVLLGDARRLSEVLPHLRDGYEIVAQCVAVPDVLGEDDILLHLKRWNKDGCGAVQKGIDELVVAKTWTLHQVKCAVADRFGLHVDKVLLSKPMRSLLAQLATVLEAIQSLNWDVDMASICSKSPWYLSTGDLLLWKCTDDPERHLEFIESMYSGGSTGGGGAARAPEPQLKILSKFDRRDNASGNTSQPESPMTPDATVTASGAVPTPPPPPTDK